MYMTTFSSEAELRDWIAKQLSKRQRVQVEKVCTNNGGRYDILASLSGVIEVKLELNRVSIYSALGQVNHYASALNKKKKIIAGLAPPAGKERSASYRLSQSLVQTINDLEIWYIDTNKKFSSFNADATPNSTALTLAVAAVVLTMMGFLIWWVDREIIKEPRYSPWKNGCYECDKWQKPEL